MIDALLYAVRDNIRDAEIGYGPPTCELTDPEGMPPPRMGNYFAAVHELATRTGPETDNKLDEYYAFGVTLTMRIAVPLDRVGDTLIATDQARQTGFNRRCDQLRAMLHMAWGVMQDANINLVAWCGKSTGSVYGFCEPARYRGRDAAVIVGGDWLRSKPEAREFALRSTLRFEDCRRFQAIGEYV